MNNEGPSDGQFIFKENEFEDNNFVAANFVAKYRRVSSLESLKDQLLQYSNGLKQQLYNIINRDYKDFITISTKLDGVDTRTNLLQKPLVDLRTDISALHEGVVTGMQAIQEKVKHRLEVGSRRKLVESFLQCMDRLDATQGILNSCGSTAVGPAEGAVGAQSQSLSSAPARASQRSRLLKALDRRLSVAAGASGVAEGDGEDRSSTLTSLLLLEKDVFTCSELERASFCLAAADECLRSLQQFLDSAESAWLSAADSPSASTHAASTHGSHGTGAGSHRAAFPQSRSAVLSMYRTLEAQARTCREQLVGRIHSHLTHLLTNALALSAAASGVTASTSAASSVSTADAPVSSSGTGRSPTALKARCVAHCLRALCSLNKGEVAEELLRSAVVGPFVRSYLTVGRVDGKGGRGSYLGLEDALQGLLDAIAGTNNAGTGTASATAGPSFLLTCLTVGEEVLCYESSGAVAVSAVATTTTAASVGTAAGGTKQHALDLLIHGVWQPIAELLRERFADMFTIGIPATLSHCYRNLVRFVIKLQALCPLHQASARSRFQSHAQVAAFFSAFKLDLYYQLRCKEVFQRVDRGCELTLRGGLTGHNLLDELYSTSGTAAAGAAGGARGVSAPSTSTASTSSDCAALRAELEGQLQLQGTAFQIPLFSVVALELRICLHPTVLLEPMAAKFLMLILRTLMRLEAHVALCCGVTTPSFPGKTDVEQLRLMYTGGVSGGVAEPSGGPASAGAAATPAATGKKGGAPASVPASAGPAGGVGATPSDQAKGVSTAAAANPLVLNVLSIEELVMVCGDLHALEGWLLGPYCTSTAAVVGTRSASSTVTASSAAAFTVDLKGADAVRAVLFAQVKKLRGARAEVWVRVTAILAAECKKALGAVKTAVVSKYRMTNKPAPETCSAYVETILAPLRRFLQQHSTLAAKLSATSTAAVAEGQNSAGLQAWLLGLVQEVTLSFGEQVAALIDTVKQMDSTLQRRSKLQAQGAAGSAGGSANMSDSEKIALQIKLDIEAYGREIASIDLDPANVAAFVSLRDLSIDSN